MNSRIKIGLIVTALCVLAWLAFRYKYQNTAVVDDLSTDASPALSPQTLQHVETSFQFYMSAKYVPPVTVLGFGENYASLSLPEVSAHFQTCFSEKQRDGCNDEVLQILCHCYILVLMHKIILSYQMAQLSNQQHIVNNTVNVSADTIHISHQFEKQRKEMAQQTYLLQQWGSRLQADLCEVEGKLQQERKTSLAFQRQLSDLGREHKLMATRALCAPPFFDALHQFIESECVQHEDERVSNEDFYNAFSVFRSKFHPNLEPPGQRDLTALMKRLGMENDQVYFNGRNTRGFKGISLRMKGNG